MIISRRNEGMAMVCQGLTGDLVIFSYMFWGQETVETLLWAYEKHRKRTQGAETDTGGGKEKR